MRYLTIASQRLLQITGQSTFNTLLSNDGGFIVIISKDYKTIGRMMLLTRYTHMMSGGSPTLVRIKYKKMMKKK